MSRSGGQNLPPPPPGAPRRKYPGANRVKKVSADQAAVGDIGALGGGGRFCPPLRDTGTGRFCNFD